MIRCRANNCNDCGDTWWLWANQQIKILSRVKCTDASKPLNKDVRKGFLQKSHQLCSNYFKKRNSSSSYVWRQNPLKIQEQRCQPLYSQKLHESQILNKSSSFCWFNTTLLPPGITKLLLMSGAATKISLWHLSPRKKSIVILPRNQSISL